MTLYARQQKRHRCKEQTFALCTRRKGGTIWENSTETCILPYVKQITSARSMHEAGHSKLVLWDNSEGWDGEGSERVIQDGDTHVHPWVIHVDVWQKTPCYCKEIILQLKLINLKNPLNIQNTKIVISGPITSWQIEGETMKTVTGFIFLSSKITANGDYSVSNLKWNLKTLAPEKES